jgi:phosphohistidine phosphatase
MDRPLTARGHADATAAGAWLAQRGYDPAVVLCSPTRRTRETWHAVALALTSAPQVQYEKQLHAASAPELLDAVKQVDEDAATVVLIGHNPGLSQLSALLDPDNADPDGLRTAAMAVHAWEGSWSDCAPGAAPVEATHTARA